MHLIRLSVIICFAIGSGAVHVVGSPFYKLLYSVAEPCLGLPAHNGGVALPGGSHI